MDPMAKTLANLLCGDTRCQAVSLEHAGVMMLSRTSWARREWLRPLSLAITPGLTGQESHLLWHCQYYEPPRPAQVINALLGGRYLEEGILPTTNEISVLKFAEDGVGSMEQNADGFFVRPSSEYQVELSGTQCAAVADNEPPVYSGQRACELLVPMLVLANSLAPTFSIAY